MGGYQSTTTVPTHSGGAGAAVSKTRVEVWLHSTSQPIFHEVTSTYQKGDMFCLRGVCGRTWKYPLWNIFRVIESAQDGDSK
jgi:hypothetical protein